MNEYLARLRALNFEKGVPDQPSKPSKPGFEGFEGDRGIGFLKYHEPVCAQCGGGVRTDPPTDAPTISIKGVDATVWLHPECFRFWIDDHSQYRRRPQ